MHKKKVATHSSQQLDDEPDLADSGISSPSTNIGHGICSRPSTKILPPGMRLSTPVKVSERKTRWQRPMIRKQVAAG
jgi:hypothetical protein